jgi:hypothetical protein
MTEEPPLLISFLRCLSWWDPAGVNILEQHNNVPEDSETVAMMNMAEKVLIVLYRMSVSGVVIQDADKVVIGPLLELCLPALKLKAELEMDKFPYSSFVCACTLRSGLQYLLDEYGSLPCSEGTLELPLNRMRTELDLDHYDTLLSTYVADIYDPVGNRYLEEGSKVPESHHWWHLFK